MSMMIACARGCGEALTVTDEMIKEAQNSGKALRVEHDVCPNEEHAPQHDFKVTIIVDRHKVGEDGWTKMAQVGATLQGPTFSSLIDNLRDEVVNQWNKVVGMADVIDQDDPEPVQETDSLDWASVDLKTLRKFGEVNDITGYKSCHKSTLVSRLGKMDIDAVILPPGWSRDSEGNIQED